MAGISYLLWRSQLEDKSSELNISLAKGNPSILSGMVPIQKRREKLSYIFFNLQCDLDLLFAILFFSVFVIFLLVSEC